MYPFLEGRISLSTHLAFLPYLFLLILTLSTLSLSLSLSVSHFQLFKTWIWTSSLGVSNKPSTDLGILLRWSSSFSFSDSCHSLSSSLSSSTATAIRAAIRTSRFLISFYIHLRIICWRSDTFDVVLQNLQRHCTLLNFFYTFLCLSFSLTLTNTLLLNCFACVFDLSAAMLSASLLTARHTRSSTLSQSGKHCRRECWPLGQIKKFVNFFFQNFQNFCSFLILLIWLHYMTIGRKKCFTVVKCTCDSGWETFF